MAAPAFLKAAVEKNGFICETGDFPMECLHHVFDKNYNDYLDWIRIFPSEFNFLNCTHWQLQKLEDSLCLFVDLIAKKNPKFLGLSIFSTWQQRYAYLICNRLKQLKLDVKIIIGGMGCAAPPIPLIDLTHLSFFDKKNSFASLMLQKNLVDYAVINDGEVELVNILHNQLTYKNTNISNEVTFDHTFLPNYDDYNLDHYMFLNNEKSLTIQGSKGCVRQCVFCSEHGNYSKYYFKQGKDIANEIIEMSQKYNIFKFHFSDSLTNGSLPVFREWVRTLAEYNIKNPEKAIRWYGNYICRKNNNTTDEEYLLMKQSGAHGLAIGAESGSDSVLAEIKKQSTVGDLLYELEKFRQFGIDCTLLMMVGFYNETWEDFLATLALLKKIQKYVVTGTVTSVRGGYTLIIPDWTNYNVDEFVIDPINSFNWLYKKNKELTLKERIRRRIIFQEFCDQLKIPVSYANEDLSTLENIMNETANFRELTDAHN
jgi:radical SAM superfamily enzyme YgiQ (UPF0313 family)